MITPGKHDGGEKTFLTKGQRETLNTLCRRILPHLEGKADKLSVEGQLVGGDPLVRKRVATALTAFDNPGVGSSSRDNRGDSPGFERPSKTSCLKAGRGAGSGRDARSFRR